MLGLHATWKYSPILFLLNASDLLSILSLKKNVENMLYWFPFHCTWSQSSPILLPLIAGLIAQWINTNPIASYLHHSIFHYRELYSMQKYSLWKWYPLSPLEDQSPNWNITPKCWWEPKFVEMWDFLQCKVNKGFQISSNWLSFFSVGYFTCVPLFCPLHALLYGSAISNLWWMAAMAVLWSLRTFSTQTSSANIWLLFMCNLSPESSSPSNHSTLTSPSKFSHE